MLKRSCAATVIVLMALAVPAFGGMYTFEVDEGLSTISLFGVSSGVEGTFVLDLGGSSNTWEGNVALDDVDVATTSNMSINLIIFTLTIDAGKLQLQDFDEPPADSGTLVYNAGTHIASDHVWTEVFAYADTNFGLLAEWSDTTDWFVEVSDDNFIGSKEPGWTPEARLSTSGSIDAEVNGIPITIPFTVTLVGAVVPEPATWALMGLGMIGLVTVARRRRAR